MAFGDEQEQATCIIVNMPICKAANCQYANVQNCQHVNMPSNKHIDLFKPRYSRQI